MLTVPSSEGGAEIPRRRGHQRYLCRVVRLGSTNTIMRRNGDDVHVPVEQDADEGQPWMIVSTESCQMCARCRNMSVLVLIWVPSLILERVWTLVRAGNRASVMWCRFVTKSPYY